MPNKCRNHYNTKKLFFLEFRSIVLNQNKSCKTQNEFFFQLELNQNHLKKVRIITEVGVHEFRLLTWQFFTLLIFDTHNVANLTYIRK